MKILSRLDWPLGRPQTARPKKSQFKATQSLSMCLDFLKAELRRLKATDIILTANWQLGQLGQPLSAQPRKGIDNYGVSVYWRRASASYQLCCDKYTSWEENLRALALHIQAVRAQERYGVATLEEAFKGAELALPVANKTRTAARLLGLKEEECKDKATVDAVYRHLAYMNHPDSGGDTSKMAEINAARDTLYTANNW
jgi:hypothetical protein